MLTKTVFVQRGVSFSLKNTRRIHKYVLSCGHEKHVTKAVYEKLYTACTVVKTGLNESIVKDCFPGT